MEKKNTTDSEAIKEIYSEAIKETYLKAIKEALLTIIIIFALIFTFIGLINASCPWDHEKPPVHQETETISIDDNNGELIISNRSIKTEKENEYISTEYNDNITVHIGDEIFLTNDPANNQDVYVVYSIYDEKLFSIKKQQPIYQTGWFGPGEQVAFVPSDYYTTGSHDIYIIQRSYKKSGNKLLKINRYYDYVKLTIK